MYTEMYIFIYMFKSKSSADPVVALTQLNLGSCAFYQEVYSGTSGIPLIY